MIVQTFPRILYYNIGELPNKVAHCEVRRDFSCYSLLPLFYLLCARDMITNLLPVSKVISIIPDLSSALASKSRISSLASFSQAL